MKRIFVLVLCLFSLFTLGACAETSAAVAPEATAIVFSGSAAAIDGEGARFENGTLTISAGGTYALSGELHGQVWVKAGEDADVRIVLDGVRIESMLSSAIYVKKTGSLTIELAEGSENYLSDAESYTFDDADEQEPDGTVFAKCDIAFEGAGSLTIQGNYEYAIRGKDNLTISDGIYEITAADTAIRGNDSVTVSGGTLAIEAGNDGIRSSNDTDVALGWVAISGGTLDIAAACDGVQAETALAVSGGTLTITTGGGSGEVAAAQQGRMPWGGAAATATNDASRKGLKAGGDLTVTGGVLTLSTADDSLHCGGNLTVMGGEIKAASGDDGMHADAALTISGGIIEITQSYEGIEGKSVLVTGGDIRVTASDDGLNAGGGADGSSLGRMGANRFAASGDYYLEISGGNLYVNAQGDGIDSNGDLIISGGVTLVCGPTNSGNGAMDSGEGAEFSVTGGVLIAAGSAGMAETPGAGSTQNTLSVGANGAAGSAVAILDANGNVLYAFRPTKVYQSVLISAPEIMTGEGYTATIGGTADSLNADGYQQGGAVAGGETVGTATVSGTLTAIGDAATFGAPGGRGQFPGGQGGPRE